MRQRRIRKDAALDLGAGNLRDSKFLLSAGFKKVVAVDKCPEAKKYVRPGIEFHAASITEFRPKKAAFDFVTCCNTLFHIEKEEVNVVFENVWRSLRPRGVFTFNVLGEHDDWAVLKPDSTTFSEEDLAFLCHRFQLVQKREWHYRVKRVKQFCHVHEFCIVLRKP